MKRLYISVGERSGDRHGAGLMEALNGECEFHGLGGPEMARHPCSQIEDWVEEAGVVGLVEVLKKYGWFKKKFDETVAEILRLAPAAVVLIDYPGFNLRLAKALRAANFAGKIIYYISPQVWAWHRGRIPQMAQWLDLMICIFPFEKQIYEGCGLRTVFAGHPLVARYRRQHSEVAREGNLIGFFPGSRRREVGKHFPILLKAGQLMAAENPNLKFVASAASEKLAVMMQHMLEADPLPGCEIQVGNAQEWMRRCAVGAVASGTATLEAAAISLPHCLIYKVAWPTYAVGKMLVRVNWLGIINILGDREVVKEFVQHKCTAKNIARELLRLHGDPAAREQLVAELDEIVLPLAAGDAYAKAAQAVREVLID